MARATVVITQNFQLVASGVVTMTVVKQGKGTLIFNETSTDSNANTETAVAEDQFLQTEVKDTYVRATGDGWTLLIDGTI